MVEPHPICSSRNIVAVRGSRKQPHEHLSEPLGQYLAHIGCDLITGAGGGVHSAVAKAFTEYQPRTGLSLGVIPGSVDSFGNYSYRRQFPNPYVELPIFTHLDHRGEGGPHRKSRAHIVMLTARLVVVLPGGAGTMDDVTLALRYRKPVVAYVGDRGRLEHLPRQVPVVHDLEQLHRFVMQHIPTPMAAA